jgi:hypothetical protein
MDFALSPATAQKMWDVIIRGLAVPPAPARATAHCD